MKKMDKREIANLFFSAFLVIGYIVCAYFFCTLVASGGNAMVTSIVNVLAFVIFGLLLFYATRVGDGKQVKRFSPATLIVLVIPALYIIFATLAQGLPFHNELVSMSQISLLAAVALGYGLPYTFLSGYEMPAEEKAVAEEKAKAVSTLGLDEAEETDTAVTDNAEKETADEDSHKDTMDRVDSILSEEKDN